MRWIFDSCGHQVRRTLFVTMCAHGNIDLASAEDFAEGPWWMPGEIDVELIRMPWLPGDELRGTSK